jgi:hypothetical protein
MRRAMLDHPSRPILVHVPTTLLDYLDGLARAAQTSRSEVIRRRLAPPPSKVMLRDCKNDDTLLGPIPRGTIR